MEEALRDPVWQAVGAILALAGLIATVVIAVRTHRRRALAYRLTSTQVLALSPQLQDPVRVTFRGREVKDVHLVEVTIVNTGTDPIPRADFEAPLRLSFPEVTAVLSAEILMTQPPNLDVQLETVVGADGYIAYVGVAPLLLNPGDGFRLKFLTTGQSPMPQVVARILGITKLGSFDGDTERYGHRLLRAALFSVALTSLVAVFTPSPASPTRPWYLAIPSWIGLILFLLIAAGALFLLADRFTRRFDAYKSFR